MKSAREVACEISECPGPEDIDDPRMHIGWCNVFALTLKQRDAEHAAELAKAQRDVREERQRANDYLAELAKAREEALAEALKAVQGERLEDPNEHDEGDRGYEGALDDAERAIAALRSKPA